MSHPFRKMDQGEIEEFLAGPRNAVVTTNRVDGAPLISPLWYLYEDGCIYFSVTVDSAKYRSLKQDPRIGICIDAGHPDERAVTIYGTAELKEKDGDWPDDILFRTGSRYTDQHDMLRTYLETIKDGSVLVSVRATKIIGRDYNH